MDQGKHDLQGLGFPGCKHRQSFARRHASLEDVAGAKVTEAGEGDLAPERTRNPPSLSPQRPGLDGRPLFHPTLRYAVVIAIPPIPHGSTLRVRQVCVPSRSSGWHGSCGGGDVTDLPCRGGVGGPPAAHRAEGGERHDRNTQDSKRHAGFPEARLTRGRGLPYPLHDKSTGVVKRENHHS